MRFAFGAVISVVAGVAGLASGPPAGGALLAFPAILPATLTLIEKGEDTDEVVADVRGTVLGAVALELFAVVAFVTSGRVLALVVWVLVARDLYVVRARMR